MLYVNIVKWVTDKFGTSSSLPSGIGLGNLPTKFKDFIQKNDHKIVEDYSYAAMTELLKDDRVNSLISLIASMASEAYKGITISPKSFFTDNKLTKKEIELLDEANKVAKRLDIKNLFFTYAWNLLVYGDYIEKMEYDKKGVHRLKSLPLNCMTILPSKDFTEGIIKTSLTEDDFYCLNETDKATIKYYPKEEIIHVSFNKRGQWKNDIQGRETYGLYSIPPISVLAKLVKWKEETIENDIKWRKKMLPKEHFTLNTEEFGLEKFGGTMEEKIAASTKATKAALNDFKEVLDDRDEPDKSILTTQSIESKVLESAGANYASPNETLQQVNRFMGGPMGMNEAFLGGEVSTGNGISTSATFASMRVSVICHKIATMLVIPIRKHLILTYPGTSIDDIERIEIQTNSSLSQVLLELSKVVLNLGLTGICSEQELRELLGYSHTTQNPYTKLLEGETILDGRIIRNSTAQVKTDGDQEVTDNSDNNKTSGAKNNNNLGNSAK